MTDENSRLRIMLLNLRGDLQLNLAHARQRCAGDPESKAETEYADFVSVIIATVDERLGAIVEDAANV